MYLIIEIVKTSIINAANAIMRTYMVIVYVQSPIYDAPSVLYNGKSVLHTQFLSVLKTRSLNVQFPVYYMHVTQ